MFCPVCKAVNDVVAVCRRCKADLGLLQQVERERARHLAGAWRALATGAAAEAARAAARAHQLRADADSARLLALAHLRAGNQRLALRWLNPRALDVPRPEACR